MTFETIYFFNIGQGCSVAAARVVAIWRADMKAAIRHLQQAKETNTFLDMTGSQKTRSIIITDYGLTIGTVFTAGTLRERMNRQLLKFSSQTLEDNLIVTDDADETDLLFDKYDDTLVSKSGVG